MGVNEGNSDCLVEKWGILRLKRPKIKVSVGNKAVCGGGGCIGESSQGKMGGNGGKWGKLGKLGGWGEIFYDLCGKMGKTWCENPQKTIFV